jgi:hypothetical protein
MNQWKGGARRRSAGAAALLLLAGALLGVLVDRFWLLPRGVEAMSLTATAMAARLDLGPSDEARIRALLDSIHADMSAAAPQGPDSLRSMARSAHMRLEAALPPRARPGFRAWIHDHHNQMMQRMGGDRMHGPGDAH